MSVPKVLRAIFGLSMLYFAWKNDAAWVLLNGFFYVGMYLEDL